jgi:hypothetical protein
MLRDKKYKETIVGETLHSTHRTYYLLKPTLQYRPVSENSIYERSLSKSYTDGNLITMEKVYQLE